MSSGNMKSCANCGNDVREGARFCASCGASVVLPDQQPSSGELGATTSSTRGRRLRWGAAAAVVALLLAGGVAAAALTLTGDDEPSAAEVAEILDELTTPTEPDLFADTNTDDESSNDDISGVDCDELNSFATDFAPTLAAAQSDPGDASEAIDELLEAFSELSSAAPDDVREDFETLSETMQEWADAASELGLEPGEVPDEEQQEEIFGLFADLLEDPEYLDAATNFSEWMETAVGQCLGTDSSDSFYGDETTETESTFGSETTTEATDFGDAGVEETCDGLLAYAALARKENSNPTIDDVEGLAASLSELASNASAEPSDSVMAGEPKASLEATAQGLEALAARLSELGLEPDSDEALNDPEIDGLVDGLGDADADLTEWFEARCSVEDQAAYEKIVNG